MPKNYTIQGTTKVQREKYAAEAFSISILDAREPSEFARACMREYIDGKRELSEARQKVLDYYHSNENA